MQRNITQNRFSSKEGFSDCLYCFCAIHFDLFNVRIILDINCRQCLRTILKKKRTNFFYHENV